jgi:hypothetical protein
MYTGPEPKSINENFPDHTYELITCLISGEQKRSLLNKYLSKFNLSRESYLEKFPGAPLMSYSSRDAYRKSALSEEGRKTRSNNITKLNLTDTNFQKKRQDAVTGFLNSDRSHPYRLNASKKAKLQHQNGLDDSIRHYFKTRYIGSDDQMNRSKRARKNNPGTREDVKQKSKDTYIRNVNLGLHNKETKFKKRLFKDTSLTYQSSYEEDFLLRCEAFQIIDKIQNAPCLTDASYPYRYYQPDYIFDNQYVIEIKSWYVENLQEKKCPGITKLKEGLVIQKGYKFIYIKDKDYTQFNNIIP